MGVVPGTRSPFVGIGGTGFLSGITAIAAGNGLFLALKSDSTLYAWGTNPFGQLGDGTTSQRNSFAAKTVPVRSCEEYISRALAMEGFSEIATAMLFVKELVARVEEPDFATVPAR